MSRQILSQICMAGMLVAPASALAQTTTGAKGKVAKILAVTCSKGVNHTQSTIQLVDQIGEGEFSTDVQTLSIRPDDCLEVLRNISNCDNVRAQYRAAKGEITGIGAFVGITGAATCTK